MIENACEVERMVDAEEVNLFAEEENPFAEEENPSVFEEENQPDAAKATLLDDEVATQHDAEEEIQHDDEVATQHDALLEIVYVVEMLFFVVGKLLFDALNHLFLHRDQQPPLFHVLQKVVLQKPSGAQAVLYVEEV